MLPETGNYRTAIASTSTIISGRATALTPTAVEATALPVGAESCDDSLIATDTTIAPFNLRDEHLASRKEWGAYVNLTTTLHRQEVAEVDKFIADIRERLEQAMRRS